MTWEVNFHPAFYKEFQGLAPDVQDELLAHAQVLEEFGPMLGRPQADTLKGSRHANMKELRFNASGGVWRIAFAFDPSRGGPSCLLPATNPAHLNGASTNS